MEIVGEPLRGSRVCGGAVGRPEPCGRAEEGVGTPEGVALG